MMEKTWDDLFKEMKVGDRISMTMADGIFQLKKIGEVRRLTSQILNKESQDD